jgi:hypothetical protein
VSEIWNVELASKLKNFTNGNIPKTQLGFSFDQKNQLPSPPPQKKKKYMTDFCLGFGIGINGLHTFFL